MTLPKLLPIPEIQTRLEVIFPPGLEARSYLVRNMSAKVVYVMLYGGMIENSGQLLRPAHVYFYTDEQAAKTDVLERTLWFAESKSPGFRPFGKQWYADTTREPIRDETLRYGLVSIGAVGKVTGVATTSSAGTYYLTTEFAVLLDPDLIGVALETAIAAWQAKHLTPAARARMALLAAGKVKKKDEVLVQCPDGTVAKLSAGPSSQISKAVIEQFAENFLTHPALLWLSESGAKVRHADEVTAKALGLNFDAAKILPDIILVNIGATGAETYLVFIEVVASDGPMDLDRKKSLLTYIKASGFPEEQCMFGTAFDDRAHAAFKKALPKLAWGSFAWFRTEPEQLMWLADEPFDITELAP